MGWYRPHDFSSPTVPTMMTIFYTHDLLCDFKKEGKCRNKQPITLPLEVKDLAINLKSRWPRREGTEIIKKHIFSTHIMKKEEDSMKDVVH